MSSPAHHTTPQAATGRGPGARMGSAVCGFVLALPHLVAVYFMLLAYLADPAGPWDSETVAHSNFASGLVLVVSAVTALLTWLFVKATWLRKWWYAIPTVLVIAALLRLTVLAPEI
ncbi:hypothetical protein [Streptomyces yerevanensis]|uniref:hypothetical protein n=1 Tax=Streptomyces yerevanensis TaxID=66378 RepID=UPI0005251A2F|nr:hypothetical protein [Streptomyces yerevanensis]